jgi:hypothetical protein
VSEPSLRDTAIREAHDRDVPYLGIDWQSFELGAEYGVDAALRVIHDSAAVAAIAHKLRLQDEGLGCSSGDDAWYEQRARALLEALGDA